MELNRDFKGMWIPKEIWLNKELTILERCLYAEINSLNGKDGCFASNEYFAKFFDIKNKETISKHISKLKKLNLVYEEKFDGRRRILRTTELSLTKFNNQVSIDSKNKSIYIDNNLENSIIDEKNFQKESSKPSIILNPVIKEIIEEITLIGGFKKHHLPKENKKLSKTIKGIQDFIMSLKAGNLVKHYEFNKVWQNSNNIEIPKNLNNFESIKKALRKAAKRHLRMKKKGYWPDDKETLAKYLSTFFYNSKCKNSWFLYCLNNKPKEIDEAIDKKEYEKLPEEIKKIVEKNCPEEWNLYKYAKKIEQLYNWYDNIDNWNDLKERNNPNDVVTYLGTFDHLLERIQEFAEANFKGSWNLGNFGYRNKTWRIFCNWMKKTYDLDISEK